MKESTSQLNIERKLSKPLLAAAAVLILSGFITLVWPGFTTFMQWTYLLHTSLGILVTVIFAPYILVHFRRTIALRRIWLAFSGILAALVFLTLAGSGLELALVGQTEALNWVLSLHVWLGVSVLVLVIAHALLHVVTFPERRQKNEPNRFPSLPEGLRKTVLLTVLAGVVVVAVAGGLYQLRPNPYHDEAVIQPYGHSYGEHPFRPSQTETVTGGFMDPRRLGQSERCASCHQEISAQWQASIHSQAGSDQTYQTNINLLSEKKGMEAARYCEGCHAPAALLSGQLTKGGKLDTPGHLQEGVGCMGCHGIDRVEHTKGVASYRFNPPQDYLFAASEHSLPTAIHNLLIRLKPEQHKADLARTVLATPELCSTCHAQFMEKDFNNWGWVKMQDDYMAWLNGPYSGQTRQTFAQDQQRRCQDCHFPLQSGQDPSASSAGLIKTHFNVGGNTAIPWATQNLAQLNRTIEFLKADKMRITIDNPNRADATETAKHLDPKLVASTEAPAYYYLGEDVTLKVAVTNAQVGHAFPGGTTDINEAWIHFLVADGQGRKIYESGAIKDDNTVDPAAYFYKSIAINRSGDEVWRHDLFNMVGDSFKRVIPPGASDLTSYTFKLADDVKGPLVITASLNYRKLNHRYAKWALKDDQVKLPIVEMASTSLVLPIRIKPEVAKVETE